MRVQVKIIHGKVLFIRRRRRRRRRRENIEHVAPTRTRTWDRESAGERAVITHAFCLGTRVTYFVICACYIIHPRNKNAYLPRKISPTQKMVVARAARGCTMQRVALHAAREQLVQPVYTM